MMPTPAGKPKVGEFVVTPNGERWKVLRRGRGEGYSVWVEDTTAPGGYRIITEFEWWMKIRGWKIEGAA